MKRFVVLPLCLVLASCVAPSTATPPAVDDFAAVLASAYASDEPGGAAIVSRDGEVLFLGAVGMADMELGVPLAPEHVFRLASVTKQYTAAGILRLVDAGEVSLDDPVSRFLPDFPHGDVTIHQLLNHTSGIRSYTDIPGYMGGELVRRDLDTDELIAVFADAPPEFPPGERWHYNNSGYVLLGAIIEHVTGKSWDRYLVEDMLVPAGITRTAYYPDEAVVPGRARGYHIENGRPINAPWLSMTQPHAAGALSATVADVDRWQQALHGGGIVSADAYARMTAVDGAAEAAGYGYGVMRGTVRGRPAIVHGGGIPGFATDALWLPDERVSVVVLSNYIGYAPAPGTVSRRLAALAVGDPYPVERPTVELPDEALAALQGTYRIDDATIRTLEYRDGALVSQRQGGQVFPVRAIGDDLFVLHTGLSHFEVERDVDGTVTGLNFYQQGEGEPEYAARISDTIEHQRAVILDRPQMERLVGDYEIQPGFVLAIRIDGDTLTGQATGQPAVPLEAAAPDRLFNRDYGLDLEFDLAGDGPAQGLTLRQAGQVIPAPRI